MGSCGSKDCVQSGIRGDPTRFLGLPPPSVVNHQERSKELARTHKLHEDPDFPATDDAIRIPQLKGTIVWKRPKEINANADFFVNGPSRFDIKQGELGDCWLLAVMASVAEIPSLFNMIVPPGQSMKGTNYVGLFHFNLWQFGDWVHVTVDDRLPVRKKTGELVFVHSAQGSEFWSALLEKAYAKLNGCYNNLSGGMQSEAMETFTGGVCIDIPLTRPQPDLFQRMRKYVQLQCLIGCDLSMFAPAAIIENGLYGGHAYSVTGVEQVRIIDKLTRNPKEQQLIRIRNPWGTSDEWKGAWSDNSPEWQQVPERTIKELHVKFKHDGEFWMAFGTFENSFTMVEVCLLTFPGIRYEEQFQSLKPNEHDSIKGEWVVNVSAGGNNEKTAAYAKNPQYRFDVLQNDEGEDHALVVISLLLRDFRKLKSKVVRRIGFRLYKISECQTTRINADGLKQLTAIQSTEWVYRSTVTTFANLKPGSYLIIPSTEDPNQAGEYMIRLVSLSKPVISELENPSRTKKRNR